MVLGCLVTEPVASETLKSTVDRLQQPFLPHPPAIPAHPNQELPQ